MNTPPRKSSVFDCPATYQIVVRGLIDPTWADRLENMIIYQTTVKAGYPITTLQGELRDQTALAGVLNALYELQLPVLSVMRLSI